METQTHDIGPWYKQKWLWFVLAPLIAVFIYGTSFLILSIVTADGIVRDEHYKNARGIEVDTSKRQTAISQNITGELLVDSLTGDIRVELTSNAALPATLSMDLVHPTHQSYDQVITLRRVSPDNGIYLGNLAKSIDGKRYLLLSDDAGTWLIREELNPPYDQNRFKLDASE